jgi:hypothetical protein
MSILPLVSFGLIILLLTSMMAKAKPWRKVEKPGKMLKTLPMGWWARVQLHRRALLAIGFAIIFGLAAGWMETSIAVLIAAFSVAALLLPMQYTFTSQGVAVGEVMFRSWQEFSGVQVGKRQVVLQHPQRFGCLTLFIKPEDMDGVFKKVKIRET